jgi:histone acetyltransferase (RNA polymerase elongator complex component)
MCGVSAENSDDLRRNIDAFRTNVDFFRTNVDAFHRNVTHAFHTNVDAFRRNIMHAFHTNVDAFRRNLKLMRAHSLVNMVTAVAILCKMAACKQCTHEFALPNCNFCPNGGHKATSKIVQAIVVYDKCLV